MSAKRFWDLMSSRLQAKGHNVSAGQCKSKFHGMKKTYKKVKDHNAKSGNARRIWKYFETVDDMFASKPWVQPVLTLDSNMISAPSEEGSASSSTESCEPPRKKRKNVDITQELIEQISLSRKERKEMHAQLMARQDRLISLLEKLAEKDSNETG